MLAMQGGSIVLNLSGNTAIDGADRNGIPSGIFSTVQTMAVGNGGNIQVAADNLALTHGSVLTANTAGQGNAENITVQLRGTAAFDGVGTSGINSGIFSVVQPTGNGTGGNTQLTGQSLMVPN